MTNKWRWRFLKTAVTFSLLFSAAVVIAALAICWHGGFDPSQIVSSALLFFGTELAISCITRIFKRNPVEEDKHHESKLEAETDEP